MSLFFREVHRGREQQLSLADDIPTLGSLWRTRFSRDLALVEEVEERRYVWVTVRHSGKHMRLRLDEFHKHFKPATPIRQEEAQ